MHLLLIIWGTITRKKFALWIDIHLEEIGWIKKQRNTIMLKIATYLFVTGKNGFNIINKQYGISEKKMIDFPYLGAEFEEQLVKQINEDRKRQVESGANIRLLISNRFIERKGYAVILKMLHLINRDILNQFEISILGTGPELEFYKSSISAFANKVHFYEWVEYDVYIQHVMRCDVYLHASLNEPFGIPPNDAMSCGKTVVASDGVISSAGRITTGINGFIYEKNNAAELAKILTQLANNRLEIYTIGERAFETAQMYAPSYNVHHMQSVL
ncbi:glycosyltransferase family 4 protein [Ferruginibacter paludis]|uniref:glycosyltransferase family 4 protein n=1 Tax=Ferruginibacter paludis TaxID=1310417 RepID=UPI0025B3C10A|nr:glycosyltransferase family 4 protein [Ferruginibacter paludis]MDN3658886.1 glycosyltransferase family 4 protein [Ferruginibacter paludis]